jgi:hypothetical protein
MPIYQHGDATTNSIAILTTSACDKGRVRCVFKARTTHEDKKHPKHAMTTNNYPRIRAAYCVPAPVLPRGAGHCGEAGSCVTRSAGVKCLDGTDIDSRRDIACAIDMATEQVE